jgi:adenosine kinase
VKVLKDHYTPQAFITTDLADNQITAFHPGAMAEAHQADATKLAPAAGESSRPTESRPCSTTRASTTR